MTLARTADLVADARTRGSGVLAFNAITLEHAEGVLDGAHRAGHPVVLQVSENAVRYHGLAAPLLHACTALAEAHPATASLHLDHVTDRSLLEGDLAGVGSVMYDASTHDDATNRDLTRQVCAELHARGLFVEAELGAIGGKGGAHDPGVRTDPGDAAAFVAATGVDALAVAVGSTHAMTEATAALDTDLVARIAAAVPVPLVLHGSSGVRREDLRAVIGSGMTKVNVGTALNVAFTSRVRDLLDADPKLTDPRRYLGPARDAVADLVAGLLDDLLG
ncbi:MAG: class II fructose-bisphosphate aldolase family protein [Nocardioidaceae bacterium]|nr:class II fructose-bisphosphate aldolase family protein [Nocardioidaceae bacterium]